MGKVLIDHFDVPGWLQHWAKWGWYVDVPAAQAAAY
jgi:hypothetical protein